jgi:hypothetical protein
VRERGVDCDTYGPSGTSLRVEKKKKRTEKKEQKKIAEGVLSRQHPRQGCSFTYQLKY